MKKTQKNSKFPHKTVFAILIVITVLTFASCEMQSLVDGWDTGEANTVYHPLDTTGVITTTSDVPPPVTTITDAPSQTQTTTAPPEEIPVITTAPPVTTTQITYYNPLSGLPCAESAARSRPIGFCVTSASGTLIGECDTVIEAPTEGDATRLLLLKCDGYSLWGRAETTSIRPHLAAIANDFFSLSIYRGTNDKNRESTDFLYDTLDLSSGYFSEDTPLKTHLASYQTSIAGAIALPYKLAGIGETVPPQDTVASYVSISYSSTARSAFTYDSVSKSYTLRSAQSLLPGETVCPTFKNILILFFDSTRRVTKDGAELTLDTDSSGVGYYITEGGVVTVLWQRDPETSNLTLSDQNGAVLTVNRGKTYVGMVTFEQRDHLILN